MQCKFEEKQYEAYLMRELLATKKDRLFPIGQVLEGQIGPDHGFFSRNLDFWRLWSLGMPVTWKQGVSLTERFWEYLKKDVDDPLFPKFKINLLVQYKRPEFITTPRGGQYPDWKQPYFRYHIDKDQQKILSMLDTRLSSQAIVTYACAAFWKRKELFESYLKQRVVADSNFVRPRRLDGHKTYSFLRGGITGKAHSKSEDVPSISLLEEIDSGLSRALEFRSNSVFLNSFAEVIRGIMIEAAPDFKATYNLMLENSGSSESTFETNMVRIMAFTFLMNLSWYVGVEYREGLND